MNLKLNREEKKIISLASLGGMLEFYDFVIYGIFSIYFANQFFPSTNHYLSILESYGVFVLGYLARPLGGIIFSHVGDEYGRKKVLIITVTLMGISSLGIGFLPTFASIGVMAPLLLLILRLTQGLALGGELPSTYVYVSETIHQHRGYAFGILMMGVNSGLLLGTLINHLLNHILSVEQLSEFGWRVPFILGGLLCLVSYRIRKSLQESASFLRIHDKPKFPLVYLFKNHFKELLVGIALTAILSGTVVVALVFMPTYLHSILKMDAKVVSNTMLIAMIINTVVIFITGIVAQKIHIRTILHSLILLGLILVPICYWLIQFPAYVLLATTILGALEGMAAMLIPLYITLLYPAKIRLTGVALSYNIGFTLFGGLAPIVITNFIQHGANIYATPALYLVVIILICALGSMSRITRG